MVKLYFHTLHKRLAFLLHYTFFWCSTLKDFMLPEQHPNVHKIRQNQLSHCANHARSFPVLDTTRQFRKLSGQWHRHRPFLCQSQRRDTRCEMPAADYDYFWCTFALLLCERSYGDWGCIALQHNFATYTTLKYAINCGKIPGNYSLLLS